jgi:hypothetical protein
MPSAELSRRVEKVVGYPPLCEMNRAQRREFHEALLDADSFEDLSGNGRRRSLRRSRTGRGCALSAATEPRLPASTRHADARTGSGTFPPGQAANGLRWCR